MYHMEVFYRKILGLELVTKTFKSLFKRPIMQMLTQFERIMKLRTVH